MTQNWTWTHAGPVKKTMELAWIRWGIKALPNKHSGHRNATEEDSDQRTSWKEIWKRNEDTRLQVQVIVRFFITYLPYLLISTQLLPATYSFESSVYLRYDVCYDQSWTWVQFSWPDPTRPDPELTRNSVPDPARPIYARLVILSSAAESFSLSTKWLFTSDANIIVSRATVFCPNSNK